MNLYRLVDGTWVGTQAEWKTKMKEMGFAANTAPDAIDVPINPKADLIAFLNKLNEERSEPRFDPNADVDVAEVRAPTTVTQSAPVVQQGLDLDAAFEAAPMSQRLRLAVSAIDGAEKMLGALIGKLTELTRGNV